MGRIKLDPPPLPPRGVLPGAVVTVFFVPPELAGMRVDQYLKWELRRTSRSRANAIVRASAYDEDGKHLRPGSRVQGGGLLFLWRPPWDETPVPTEVPILHEDEHLLAVSKPAHLPVHPTARYHKNTLIKILQARYPEQWLSLGHRIDRETSGVVLVSKTSECDRALKRKLEHRDGIEKVYDAFTWGRPRGLTAGEPERCSLPLGLDHGSAYKVKMRVYDAREPGAQLSSTVFDVREVRHHPEDRARAYTHVECTLESGRQHQIRVHLAALDAPIVGDKLYGPDDGCFARASDGELTEDDLFALELPRHALHARHLRFDHPVTGTPLHIEAPLPDDLAAFWQGCAR